jgi:hypothetical protein
MFEQQPGDERVKDGRQESLVLYDVPVEVEAG